MKYAIYHIPTQRWFAGITKNLSTTTTQGPHEEFKYPGQAEATPIMHRIKKWCGPHIASQFEIRPISR